MRSFFKKADVIIGHNIIAFDVRMFERLLGIKIKCKQIDTLALSWYLYPELARHGLEAWGEYFGVPKPKIADWHGLTIEEYSHRCEEDVKINVKLWRKMLPYLLDIYGTQKKMWEFLSYLQFKMYCTRLQIDSRWKLDVAHTEEALENLRQLKEEKLLQLIEVMPKVPKYTVKSKPKRFINKAGDYTKLGTDWIRLLTERGLPPSHEEDIQIESGQEDGNPDSPEQKKAWLFSLGWRPMTFKYVKDKDGETRAIPQIMQEHGKGICESIKQLYDKEPNLELLDGLGVITHRMGVLKGFLREKSEDDFVTARVSGLTNTLRFKHKEVVNLPKVEKLYGELGRGALIAADGMILCGSDMSSLEDRIKQHFIFPLDPDYVNSMNQEDFDPHLVIAEMAGMLTAAQVSEYKNGVKTWKPVRDIAKNGNYACQYGAGPARLVLTCGISLEEATVLHKAYWRLNWAIKEIATQQKYKTINDQMWLYNPISKFWYSLRYVKDIFSTLVQGTASYVFDMWVKNILEERPQLTGQFHDEVVLQIKEGFEEQCTALIRRAIDKLNGQIKLNRLLDVSVQYHHRYSGIH